MVDAVDLLVIGGGVNGAGIARDAAGRGLSVVLCEKDDLAAGNLVPIGQARAWRLALSRILRVSARARGADRARSAAQRGAAHHLADALRAAAFSPDDRPAWLVRLGLFLYDHLGGRKKLPRHPHARSRARPRKGAPIKDDIRKAFEYSDCWVDDARLVVLNALDATERGATVLTRTACVSARREGGALARRN